METVDAIVSILTGKGLAGLAQKGGELAWRALTGAVEGVRDWLKTKPEVAPAVRDVEARPDDPSASAELARRLERAVATDPELASTLKRLAEALARARAGAHQDAARMANEFHAAVQKVINIQNMSGTINMGD